jgi:hypothetical protein
MADEQGGNSRDFNEKATQTFTLWQQYNILRRLNSLADVSLEDPEFIKFCKMNKSALASLSSTPVINDNRGSDPSSTLSMIESKSKLMVASMMSSGGIGKSLGFNSRSIHQVEKAVDHKSLPRSTEGIEVNVLLTCELVFEGKDSMQSMLSCLSGLDRKVIEKMSTSDFAFLSLDSGNIFTFGQLKFYHI